MLKQWILLLLVAVLAGCVERTITISSEPKGALVFLNDKEVGRTPVTVPFQWYGDYEVILRKEGQVPLKTHKRTTQPWYEYFPVDIFSELLYPGTIHNEHVWEFQMEKSEPVNLKELEQRALEIRDEAGVEASMATTQPVATPCPTQPAEK